MHQTQNSQPNPPLDLAPLEQRQLPPRYQRPTLGETPNPVTAYKRATEPSQLTYAFPASEISLLPQANTRVGSFPSPRCKFAFSTISEQILLKQDVNLYSPDGLPQPAGRQIAFPLNGVRNRMLQHSTLLKHIFLVLPLAALLSVLFGPGNSVHAQDYRIYTRVSLQEANAPESKPKVISRSLTIWHAGKVYDYMDGVGELVIYDPHQERYTIINGNHKMACTLDFSELRHYLNVGRTHAKEFIADLAEANLPESRREIEKITFQLDPKFEIQYDEGSTRLLCDSPHMSYQIEAIPAPGPDVATAFLKYADWAAQLNFVLHGQSLLPGPRMQVNEALKEKDWIPNQVTLSLKDKKGTVLMADHSIQWELGYTDRARIMEWNTLQNSSELKFVSFQNYLVRLSNNVKQ